MNSARFTGSQVHRFDVRQVRGVLPSILSPCAACWRPCSSSCSRAATGWLQLFPAISHSGPGNGPTTCAGSPAAASASRCSNARSRSTTAAITVERRRQPLRVAPDSRLTAVVRIETDHHATDLRWSPRVAAEIADAAQMPRATAVQIDFDARLSERPFYAALLREVRARVRPPLRLSMTALASWCADDPWIEPGVVDEIVPMLFQMGPDARRIVTRLQEDRRWPVEACDVRARRVDRRAVVAPAAGHDHLHLARPQRLDGAPAWRRSPRGRVLEARGEPRWLAQPSARLVAMTAVVSLAGRRAADAAAHDAGRCACGVTHRLHGVHVHRRARDAGIRAGAARHHPAQLRESVPRGGVADARRQAADGRGTAGLSQRE